MARPRRTTRAQNMGQNRNVQMRNNARRPGTFQGGLSVNQGIAPQRPMPSPSQGMQQCPPGQEPARDPNTGAIFCEACTQEDIARYYNTFYPKQQPID